jgi:hypothetical protein
MGKGDNGDVFLFLFSFYDGVGEQRISRNHEAWKVMFLGLLGGNKLERSRFI